MRWRVLMTSTSHPQMIYTKDSNRAWIANPIKFGAQPTNCLKDKRGKDGVRPSRRVHFEFTTIKADILLKSQLKPDNRAVRVVILLSQGLSATINFINKSVKSKLCVSGLFRFFGNVHKCATETDLCWMDGDGDVTWWGHLVPWQTEIRVHMLTANYY